MSKVLSLGQLIRGWCLEADLAREHANPNRSTAFDQCAQEVDNWAKAMLSILESSAYSVRLRGKVDVRERVVRLGQIKTFLGASA